MSKITEVFKKDIENGLLTYYRLFKNERTGNYEIISRSGHIVCVIPINDFSENEHRQLALNIIGTFKCGSMAWLNTDPVIDRLVCDKQLNECLQKEADLERCIYRPFSWSSLEPVSYNPEVLKFASERLQSINEA